MTTPKTIHQTVTETHGTVYCPMCTHTVDATVIVGRRSSYTKPGQKCGRCHASLDAGYVMRLDQAA